MLETPLEACFDYKFQNQVVEELKASLEEVKETYMEININEIIQNTVTRFLSIKVLSDDEGRDIVKMERLRDSFEKGLEGLDEITKVLIFTKVLNVIKGDPTFRTLHL